MLRTRLLVALALLSLAACNNNGGSGTDAGGGTADTGGGGADTGSGSGIAACEAAVDAVISACMAESMPPQDRLCRYQVYRTLCTTGRTAVVTAMMNCLLMDACQTPSDPSGATACVAGVVSANTNAAQTAFNTAYCGCDTAAIGCPTAPQYTSAEVAQFSDAETNTMATCLAASCADPTSCFTMSTAGTALFACSGP